MNHQLPNRLEQHGRFMAEYYRLLDSRGNEQLLVTLRDDTVQPDDTIRSREFTADMDTLERFASYQASATDYTKPFDRRIPDRVEHFRDYTAHFHAGTTPKGREVCAVRLSYSKDRGDGTQASQPDMWVDHKAVKEFASQGMAYEEELGHTKRWHPLVKVVEPGESPETGLVRVSSSIENTGRQIEDSQIYADRTSLVLWPQPFRRAFEPGDEFTVRRASEGSYGYEKIRRGIDQQFWKRDREGPSHVVGLWHDRSCEPYPGMLVTFNTAYEPNGDPREILTFPANSRGEAGSPKEVEYLLIERSTKDPSHGSIKELFGRDADRAVARLNEETHLHIEQDKALTVDQKLQDDLSVQSMPRGYRI